MEDVKSLKKDPLIPTMITTSKSDWDSENTAHVSLEDKMEEIETVAEEIIQSEDILENPVEGVFATETLRKLSGKKEISFIPEIPEESRASSLDRLRDSPTDDEIPLLKSPGEYNNNN